MNIKISACILTISDRCSKGLAIDKSGPILKDSIKSKGWEVLEYKIVPDEAEAIRDTILDWCDKKGATLILTTGGTGIGPRDITPEVTRKLLHKELHGVMQVILIEGLKKTPYAALSRAAAGIRDKTIIINLPGSPKGALESFEAVQHIIPHALLMMSGEGH